MRTQAIYAVAFLNHAMALRVHEGVFNDVDLEDKELADAIKAQILADYFSFDDEQDARNMNGFDDFSVIKIESKLPPPDVWVKVKDGRISDVLASEEVRVHQLDEANNKILEFHCGAETQS